MNGIKITNRKRLLAIFVALDMLLTMTACGTTNNNHEDTTNNYQGTDSETAEFWLSKMDTNPDKVLLSTEEIDTLNATMKQYWADNLESGYYDVFGFQETIEKDTLQTRIETTNPKDRSLYCKGELVTKAQWEEACKNYNFESMPSEVKASYGVIVNSTGAYDFPASEIYTGSNLDESENQLQQSYLRMNEPVVVLWETADKAWYYVVAQEYIGWVEAKDCAIFESKEDWETYHKQDKFYMVTSDIEISGIEGTVLMGTKLFVSDKGELCIPKRGEDGKVVLAYQALLDASKLHEGYLPYTSANVLKLAFQELEEPYGWGGIHGNRDCSLYVMHIYDCFGIELPRNSAMQMKIPEMRAKAEGMSASEKEAVLEETNPGAIIGISGHVMLYLGEENGQHYVISMLGSYIPEDVTENFGDHIVSAQKCMINTLDVHRRNGNTWLQEIIDISDIK